MRSQAVRSFLQTSTKRRILAIRCFSEDGGSLHSKDIAFKPAESGWGAGRKYEQNYDNIFGKKKKEELPKGEARPTGTDVTDN
ncbi:hypothetical protein MHU86_8494 [Fragilaria crotonensis]|nr:hypothetical protein MHU86_8494 [Fragilaria crotonensis]